MRNVPLTDVDDVDRKVVAIATDYPDGMLLDTHRHRRAQFLYVMTGLMEVETDDGAWIVPPFSRVWIPADHPHRVRMNAVTTSSLYIESAAAPRPARRCEVLRVRPLVHHLLAAAAEAPARYEDQGLDGALIELILHELRQASTLPLYAPLPEDRALALLCRAFLRKPLIRTTAGEWARQLNKSPRTFSRFFKQQTGMSFGAWRQQACLLAALPNLSARVPVTTVA